MAQPGRGDRTAYARYLSGMDASMRQKVALTAAHLLCEGTIADMGMGSGAGSHALAALHPELRVIGVDLDPEMVAIARETHVLPNLSFVVGDIAAKCFEDGTLDGIFDSSVLHHVTSFGGYRHDAALDALRAQVASLRDHGVLVVRDFVDPGPGEVTIDLRDDDGDAGDDPRTCSTARLFERFAREARSLHPERGFPMERVEGADVPAGWRRYRCARVHAVEMALRKDYRADWEAEVREEYTYFTQEEFERAMASLALRVLASAPLRNPWIVRHRFEGQLVIRELDGTICDPPATNYVIVGEKVPAGEGVRFEDRGDHAPIGFLELSAWEDLRDGSIKDLARRPGRTLDVIPYFEQAGELFVLARTSYPRPLASSLLASPPIDGVRSPEWMAEPMIVLQGDKPLGQTVEEALLEHARIAPDRIASMRPGTTYYPSPGGTQEEVASMLVAIEPLFVEESLPRRSVLSSQGRLRAIEARQLLRAAQVGGMPDARLEINAQDLIARRGGDRGPWIGEAITLREGALPDDGATTMLALARRPPRRSFRRADRARSTGFLEVRARRFAELAADGRALAELPLELVIPRTRSTTTIAIAPLLRARGTIWIGVDDDDLPAVQCFEGSSEILVAPAWRLPREVQTIRAGRAFAIERLRAEYGVVAGDAFELGGRWMPSAGLSPEVVHALAVEVRAALPAPRALRWVELADALAGARAITEGHLRVCVLRAAHALGV